MQAINAVFLKLFLFFCIPGMYYNQLREYLHWSQRNIESEYVYLKIHIYNIICLDTEHWTVLILAVINLAIFFIIHVIVASLFLYFFMISIDFIN